MCPNPGYGSNPAVRARRGYRLLLRDPSLGPFLLNAKAQRRQDAKGTWVGPMSFWVVGRPSSPGQFLLNAKAQRRKGDCGWPEVVLVCRDTLHFRAPKHYFASLRLCVFALMSVSRTGGLREEETRNTASPLSCAPNIALRLCVFALMSVSRTGGLRRGTMVTTADRNQAFRIANNPSSVKLVRLENQVTNP